MTSEQNKTLAIELFARFSASDIPGVLDLMSDDATWWIAGKPEAVSAGGVHSKDEMARMFRRMLKQLEDGLKMTVKGAIAEGDRVAVEVESFGRLRNGRVYNNQYHTLMTFRDGRIVEVREYLDTQHVLATWLAP